RKPRPPGGDLGAGRGPSGAWRRGRPPAGQADAVSAPRRRLLRPGIEDVPAYPASALTAAVRLDRNESPEELASDLRESVLAALAAARWSRYPDAHGSELKTAVATREGLPAEAVVVGNGSNSLFLSLFVAADD